MPIAQTSLTSMRRKTSRPNSISHFSRARWGSPSTRSAPRPSRTCTRYRSSLCVSSLLHYPSSITPCARLLYHSVFFRGVVLMPSNAERGDRRGGAPAILHRLPWGQPRAEERSYAEARDTCGRRTRRETYRPPTGEEWWAADDGQVDAVCTHYRNGNVFLAL